MIERVFYNNSAYNVIDQINFKSRTYFIIKNDKDLKYIELSNNKYILPPVNLSIRANQGKSLTYLRQQYLLKYLISYISAHDLNINEINEITKEFKEFIKTDKINEYLYSKYLSTDKFNSETNEILYDLQTTLELSLKSEYIIDPSYQYVPIKKEQKEPINPKYLENIEIDIEYPETETFDKKDNKTIKKFTFKGVLEALTLIFPVAAIEIVSFLIIIYWR